MATESGVRRLVLTHFSQRYPDPRRFHDEARAHFDGELVDRRGSDHGAGAAPPGSLGRVTITLRPATDDDLMAVGALHQRSRVAAYSRFLPAEALADPTPEAMGRYWVERWPWERDTHRMTVAERDGALVGLQLPGPGRRGRPGHRAAQRDPPRPGRAGPGRRPRADGGRAGRHAGAGLAAGRALGAPGQRPRPAFYERGGWTPDRRRSARSTSAQPSHPNSATPAPSSPSHASPHRPRPRPRRSCTF